MITLVGPKQSEEETTALVVNVTSKAKGWSRALSPFWCGPVELYNGLISQKMENAWQFLKVYPSMIDDEGEPSEEYWAWAKKGWASRRGTRYPMGKGASPLYVFWKGKKLSYLEAKVKVYCSLYAETVEGTESFEILRSLYEERGDIALWDFDSYDHRSLGMSYTDVLLSEDMKFGHGFVLAMMLDGDRAWEKINF